VLVLSKRLVLQWVSASLPSNDVSVGLGLQAQPIISPQAMKWFYTGPYSMYLPGASVAGMSSALFATFGPGESTHVHLNINSVSNIDSTVTLSGYLIDATN
jgi:hypothetical protein